MKHFPLYAIISIFVFTSCSLGKQVQQTRVEKILAEINDPKSDYIVVASHRGD